MLHQCAYRNYGIATDELNRAIFKLPGWFVKNYNIAYSRKQAMNLYRIISSRKTW